MIAAPSKLHAINLFSLILIGLVGSCHSISTINYTNRFGVEKSYENLIFIENNFHDMQRIWADNESRQIGRSPEETAKQALFELEKNVELTLAHSARSTGFNDTKKIYVDLVKKYGVSYFLSKTKYFNYDELMVLSASKGLSQTKLFADKK